MTTDSIHSAHVIFLLIALGILFGLGWGLVQMALQWPVSRIGGAAAIICALLLLIAWLVCGMPRDTTDPAIKAAALADLLSGDQPAVVAARYGLDRGLVKMWKQRHVTVDVTDDRAPHVTVMHRPQIEAQQLAIGDLVMDNLRAKLIATQRIAEYATTPTWLDKQTAADVAILFEALDRSAIGILDRLARGSRADDADRGDA